MTKEFTKTNISQSLGVVLHPGCYPTHDMSIYRAAQARIDASNPIAHGIHSNLLSTLQLWAYVQSAPEAERAIIAMGRRDAAFDAGLSLPVLRLHSGDKTPSATPAYWEVIGMVDQHAYLKIAPDDDIRVDDMTAFDILHPCLASDKWRQISAVDDVYNVADIVQTYFWTGPPMADILAYGEAPIESNQANPGSMSWNFGFGGDASSSCIAATRQGACTDYTSVMGADRFGQALCDLRQDEDVDHAYIHTGTQVLMGPHFVSHGTRGHHFDCLHVGLATGCSQTMQLPLQTIAAAKASHLSEISLAISDTVYDAGLAAMAHARATGVLVLFDTNLHLRLRPLACARIAAQEATRTYDLRLPSRDGVTVLPDCHDRDGIVDTLLGWGVKLVALKVDAEDCYVTTPESRTLVPRHTVNAIDATGAGGCSGGSLVARIVVGDSSVEAAWYINVAAAIFTTGHGVVTPIPWAEVV